MFIKYFLLLLLTILSINSWKNNKVLIDVYIESECPWCAMFISNQLVGVVENLGQYVTAKLYPFGMAKMIKTSKGYNFTCQHGPLECVGNTILGCAINVTSQDVYVPFTACAMKNLDPTDDYLQCAKKYNFNITSLNNCAYGPLGNEIQYYNAISTPPHPGVPYIIINKHFDNNTWYRALEDLKGVVCDLLEVKPKECLSK